MNTQELQGHWDQIRGKVKEKWGQLTDDDLTVAAGNFDQLIGRIEQKTGEARASVENFLDELMASDSVLMRAKDAAVDAGGAALATAREGVNRVAEGARETYHQADELVRHHPETSMVAVLGLGFVTGLVLGVMCRSNGHSW